MENNQEPYDEKSILRQSHIALIIVGIVLMFFSLLGFLYGKENDNNFLINGGIIVFLIGLTLSIFIGVCIYTAKKKELKK